MTILNVPVIHLLLYSFSACSETTTSTGAPTSKNEIEIPGQDAHKSIVIGGSIGAVIITILFCIIVVLIIAALKLNSKPNTQDEPPEVDGNTHTYIHIQTCMHAHANGHHVCSCMHACTLTHMCPHTRTHTLANTHSHTHTHKHTEYTHTDTHKHACTHRKCIS